MTFRPVTPKNSMGQNLGQINDMVRQLNKEQQVKTFKQAGGSNAIISGRLPFTTTDGRIAYGTLYYDLDGTPRALIGTGPDGSFVFAVSKTGEDVLTALGL